MWFHKNLFVRTRHELDLEVGGELAPAKIILQRAEKRLSSGPEQDNSSLILSFDVLHQSVQMDLPEL
jgi:hypothetical protein